MGLHTLFERWKGMNNRSDNGAIIPTATYRLQFNGCFRFSDAAQIVPYLHSLGITDIYASPFLKARQGSSHGYDIVNHNSLNPEIGTEEELNAYVDQLRTHGMGQILDIVPNHMCIESCDNAWWMDLLENGPSSIYAVFFDIDWKPVKPEMENKALIEVTAFFPVYRTYITGREVSDRDRQYVEYAVSKARR
jgi:(1->4)-alpha-D-glucan 1-alpha-D-glucosylmutase